MSIANLSNIKEKENCLIVNIEDKTSITTVINNTIQNVKKLDIGNEDILQKIKTKENSYSKAYQIEKETTIYRRFRYCRRKLFRANNANTL